MRKKYFSLTSIILLIILLSLASCGKKEGASSGAKETKSLATETPAASKTTEDDKTELTSEATTEADPHRDNSIQVFLPSADGTSTYAENDVIIDTSHLQEGYFMVQYSGSNPTVRMLVDTPIEREYNYLLRKNGSYEAFPLSDGEGTYHVSVYENVSGDEYALCASTDLEVTLPDDKKPFLYSNQFVDFTADMKTVAKGQELAADAFTDLDVVKSVYHYAAENIKYDYDKADGIEDDYLPVVDNTLAEGKGICFDYSALVCTMLRTQGIPTKLEIGYRGDVYHAWISVYTKEEGWIDDIIVFDGTDWSLMDPTLASEADKGTMEKYMKGQSDYYETFYEY